MEKIEQVELLQGKLLETELNEAAAKLETKQVRLQSWIDALWVKYGKVKGEDILQPDGTWTKVQK